MHSYAFNPPVGLVMVVGMALQVDQQPVGPLVRGVPAVVRFDVLVLALPQMFAGQAIMFDIVHDF